MNAESMRDLLVRAASGDPLNETEQQTLLDWLDTRPDARTALLADEAIDRDLRYLGAIGATDDDFLAATLARITSQTSPLTPPDTAAQLLPEPEPWVVTRNPTTRRTPLDVAHRSPHIATWRQGMIAALASAVVVLSAALGWALWRKQQTRLEAQRTAPSGDLPHTDVRPPSEAIAAPPPRTNSTPPSLTFVRLASAREARWATPITVGQRLKPGTLHLEQGSADLEFDNGVVAHVAGPALLELVSPTELLLSHGTLSALVPPPATGFTVTTPVARVIDLGTEFEVNVAETGNTETHVRRGKVSFLPQRRGELPGKALELVADGLDRAQATIPDVTAPVLPVSTIFSGDGGEFLATICAQGKTIEFTTRESFDDYRTHLMQQLRESPADFSQQWSIMVAATGGGGTHVTTTAAGGGNVRTATVRENDQTVSLTETGAGIVVRIITTVDGKPHVREVAAKTAAELETKDPAAFQLYRKHLGRDANAPGPLPAFPTPQDPRKMLREHLRQQLEGNDLNPQLRAMLERMQRQFDN